MSKSQNELTFPCRLNIEKRRRGRTKADGIRSVRRKLPVPRTLTSINIEIEFLTNIIWVDMTSTPPTQEKPILDKPGATSTSRCQDSSCLFFHIYNSHCIWAELRSLSPSHKLTKLFYLEHLVIWFHITQLQSPVCRWIHLASLRTDVNGERTPIWSDDSQLQQCLYSYGDSNGWKEWKEMMFSFVFNQFVEARKRTMWSFNNKLMGKCRPGCNSISEILL